MLYLVCESDVKNVKAGSKKVKHNASVNFNRDHPGLLGHTERFLMITLIRGPSQPMCIARRETISGHFLCHMQKFRSDEVEGKSLFIGRFCLPFESFKSI